MCRSTTVLDALTYPRHFALLTAFAVLTGVLSRLSFPPSLSIAFALYGALHATAVIISLRTPPPVGRSCLFIGTAAALSALTLHLGIFTAHWSASLPGGLGAYVALAIASGIGAVIYGICIRLFGFYRLTAGTLAVISLGCLSASCVALVVLRECRFLGPWWLAAVWWYAFSASLWFRDRRPAIAKLTR